MEETLLYWLFLFTLSAFIIHLGNVEFTDEDTAKVKNPEGLFLLFCHHAVVFPHSKNPPYLVDNSVLEAAAPLLGLNVEELRLSLQERENLIRGDIFKVLSSTCVNL